MSWFTKIEEEEMMWSVDNEECLDSLREIRDAPSGEKCIVAEGNGHHVVFFESIVDGDVTLVESSVMPDWNAVNSGPERTMAGRVENVYEFSDDWEDVYVSNELPYCLR